jgi:hypothetical protein
MGLEADHRAAGDGAPELGADAPGVTSPTADQRHGGKRRRGRGLLPLGGGRLLRFSRRSRASPTGPGFEEAEDQLYLALGRVAVNWSLVELVSGLVLMGLLGSREESLARAVVAGQRVENVWATIEALLVAYGEPVEEQLAEFRLWRRNANNLRRRRNEAIHSAWSLTGSAGKAAAWDMMSQRAKHGARSDLFPGGVPDLEELAQSIAALEGRLTVIHEQIFLAPDPTRHDPRSEIPAAD